MNSYSDINIQKELINYFQKDGILSKKFPDFEYRKSQLDMALAVADTLENKRHKFIEAPTGIGKSFAYLTAAILYAKKYKKKAIISTHTINLQEQLIFKDIPLLKESFPFEFEANILKGKNNYLCPKRLLKSINTKSTLFVNDEIKNLENIYQWGLNTKDGTLSDIPFTVLPQVWNEICADVNICTNKTCGGIKDTNCFYQKAKFKIIESDVVILNHYLLFTLFSYLSKDSKDGYLYHNDFIIFDEGHTIESAASELAFPRVSREMIRYHIFRLYNPKKQKGFLLNYNSLHIINLIHNILNANESFFYGIKSKIFRNNTITKDKNAVRIYEKNFTENILDKYFTELIDHLNILKKEAKTEINLNEINDYINRFHSINSLINSFIHLEKDDFVYWVEQSASQKNPNITLCASPVNIADYLRDSLFKENNSCIITSATLTINEDDFSYYKKRLGGEIAGSLKLPTQFDFYRNVKIYIPKDYFLIPSTENSQKYSTALKKWIMNYIYKTKGKALVLFTNSNIMRSIAEDAKMLLNESGIDLLIQGDGMSRKQLLEVFKSNINSVLFGLESFWLGVDVPGESLSNLIITRLPFQVPDHPLIKAKMEYIDANGGNSFMDYSLPEAILKFRQGFGRLIRNSNDEGIVVILDYRILSKYYGKYFFNSIEPCPVIIDEPSED